MDRTLGVKAARVAIVLAVFALWEMLSRTGIVNPRLLPRRPIPSSCSVSCYSARVCETISS